MLLVSLIFAHYTTVCVQNDECCSTCGTKKDSDKLLCCELCPAVYHLYCLKPPLRSIPAGDWYCTHCRSILGLEHVDKFLAARTQMVVSTYLLPVSAYRLWSLLLFQRHSASSHIHLRIHCNRPKLDVTCCIAEMSLTTCSTSGQPYCHTCQQPGLCMLHRTYTYEHLTIAESAGPGGRKGRRGGSSSAAG